MRLLYACTAADQILEAARLNTYHVTNLPEMKSGLGALNICQSLALRGLFGWLHVNNDIGLKTIQI